MATVRGKRSTRGPVAIQPGAMIGRYRVGRLLHEGGMAQLYAIESRTPLILKVPKLGPDHPSSCLISFENELRVLERLHGPHVPKLVASGDLTTQPYLIMERLIGDDLAQAAQRAPLPVDELCRLGWRLARAVQAAHHQNVIHLDLNPSNVRNRADGTMVLIDFGLAHHAALPDLQDSALGVEEGTTATIAPEQLHHVRTDSRSDIYALGAILYHLATGCHPFGRPNLLSLKRRLVAPPWPPRVHRPDLPPWLQEIILRCLEIRPEDRYTTAKRVAHQLAHPETVPDTRRAHYRTPPGLVPRTCTWVRSIFQKFDDEKGQRPYDRLTTSPHVLVALDLAHASEAQKEALRRAVRRLSASEPRAYFTCLSVVPETEREQAIMNEKPAPNLACHVLMRNWAQSLRLPEGRLVFQVLPGNPASTLLDYARRHLVDHIIIGARGSSRLRQHLGSVSASVAAQASCTVTVVRTRKDARIKEKED